MSSQKPVALFAVGSFFFIKQGRVISLAAGAPFLFDSLLTGQFIEIASRLSAPMCFFYGVVYIHLRNPLNGLCWVVCLSFSRRLNLPASATAAAAAKTTTGLWEPLSFHFRQGDTVLSLPICSYPSLSRIPDSVASKTNEFFFLSLSLFLVELCRLVGDIYKNDIFVLVLSSTTGFLSSSVSTLLLQDVIELKQTSSVLLLHFFLDSWLLAK